MLKKGEAGIYLCGYLQRTDYKVNKHNHHQSNHVKRELMKLITSNEKTVWTIKGDVDYQKKQPNLKQCSKESANLNVPPYLGCSLGKEAKIWDGIQKDVYKTSAI